MPGWAVKSICKGLQYMVQSAASFVHTPNQSYLFLMWVHANAMASECEKDQRCCTHHICRGSTFELTWETI